MSDIQNVDLESGDSMTYPANFLQVTDIQRVIAIRNELNQTIERLEGLDANVEEIISAGNLVLESVEAMQSFVTASMNWAIKLGGTVDDVEYSSKHYSTLAKQSSDNADSKHSDISNWRTEISDKHLSVVTLEGLAQMAKVVAEKWANFMTGPVEGSEYSAKHYAVNAAASQLDVAAKYGQITTWHTTVNEKHGQVEIYWSETKNFRDEAANWAKGTGVISGGLFSAKKYAEDALAHMLKSQKWADEESNIAVEAGKYSAKHWATIAQNLYSTIAPNIGEGKFFVRDSVMALKTAYGSEGAYAVVTQYSNAYSSIEGGGIFVWKPVFSGYLDNLGYAIKTDDNLGYWIRQVDGTYNPIMFGARGDGATDDTVAVRAMFIVAEGRDITGLGKKYALNVDHGKDIDTGGADTDPLNKEYGPRVIDGHGVGTISDTNQFLNNPIGYGARRWFCINRVSSLTNIKFVPVGSTYLSVFFGRRNTRPDSEYSSTRGDWFIGQHKQFSDIEIEGDVALTGWYNTYKGLYIKGYTWIIANTPKSNIYGETDVRDNLNGGFYYNTITGCRFEERFIVDTRYGSTNSNAFISNHFRSGIEYRNTGPSGFYVTSGEKSHHGNLYSNNEVSRHKRILMPDGVYKGGYYSIAKRDNVRFGGYNRFTNTYLEGGIVHDNETDRSSTARGRFYGDGFIVEGMQTAGMTDTWNAGNMGTDMIFGSGAPELVRGVPMIYPMAILDVGGDWSVIDSSTQYPPCYKISGGANVVVCTKGIVPSGYSSLITSTGYLDGEPTRTSKAILIDNNGEQREIAIHPERFKNDKVLKSYALIYKPLRNAKLTILGKRLSNDFNGVNNKTLNTIYGGTKIYKEDGWEMVTGMSYGEINFYLEKADDDNPNSAVMLISSCRVCKGSALVAPSSVPTTVVSGVTPSPKLTKLVGIRFSIIRDTGTGEYIIVSPDLYPTSVGADYIAPEIFLDETGKAIVSETSVSGKYTIAPVKSIPGLGNAGAGRLYVKVGGVNSSARFMYGNYREPNNSHTIVMTNYGGAHVFINIRKKSDGSSQNPTGAILFDLYFNIPE
jgi:hypothetical protein